jgi:hypothetical protein
MSSPFSLWKNRREEQERIEREDRERAREKDRLEREKVESPPKTPPQSR